VVVRGPQAVARQANNNCYLEQGET
jgi:hypothetical protein